MPLVTRNMLHDNPPIHAFATSETSLGSQTMEPLSQRSAFQAMASDLGNAPLVDFSMGTFSPETNFHSRIATWSSVVRGSSLPSRPTRIYPPHCKEHSTVPTCERGSDTSFSTNLVQLFSWDEIHSKKTCNIPPLVIGLDDIAGDRYLMPRQDSFMYYDPCVETLDPIVTHRSISLSPYDPVLQHPGIFYRHAVRLFLEVPCLSRLTNGPLYRYIGNYYIHKTEVFLPSHQWAKLRRDVKDTIVQRFIHKYGGPANSYRVRNTYSEVEIHELYNHGPRLPLVLLFPTSRGHPGVRPPLPNPEAEHQYQLTAEFTPADRIPPYRPQDHRAADITHQARQRILDFDAAHHLSTLETSSDEDGTETHDGSNIAVTAATSLRHCTVFVLMLMRSSPLEIRTFCEYLRCTADPMTEEGISRLGILQTLQNFSKPIPASPSVSSSIEDRSDHDLSESDGSKLSPQPRLTLMPWFVGLESEAGLATGN